MGFWKSPQFYFPAGIAIDSLGFLFVADSRNQSIRKITPSGAVTTIGGNPGIPDASGSPAGAFQNGNGINAFFNSPFGIAVERSGTVLIMDYNNNLIRTGTTGTTAVGLRLASPAIDSKVGTFGFEIVGPSGGVAVVESSMDFTSWKPEFTNAVGGRINIQSPKPGEDSHRYYRGRSP